MDYPKLLFPEGRRGFGDNPNTVDGLSKGVQPQNCTVLFTGHESKPPRGDRREHFLVRTEDGTVCYLRICTAMKDSGYDEYAVFHSIHPEGGANKWGETAASQVERFDRSVECGYLVNAKKHTALY